MVGGEAGAIERVKHFLDVLDAYAAAVTAGAKYPFVARRGGVRAGRYKGNSACSGDNKGGNDSKQFFHILAIIPAFCLFCKQKCDKYRSEILDY